MTEAVPTEVIAGAVATAEVSHWLDPVVLNILKQLLTLLVVFVLFQPGYGGGYDDRSGGYGGSRGGGGGGYGGYECTIFDSMILHIEECFFLTILSSAFSQIR